jgi:hypothetical protein
VLICWYRASLCRTACTTRGCQFFEKRVQNTISVGQNSAHRYIWRITSQQI